MAELGLTEIANMTVQGWRVRGISGLDAAAAYFVVQHLQQICSKGRTLVAVLHQPSSEVFALFKRLYLLAGGDVVFFGSVDSAAETFAAAGHPCPPFLNPADHFLRCLNKEFAEGAAVDKCTAELVDAYNKSYAKKAAITQVAKYSMRHGQIFVPPKMPRWACQVTVLIHRGLLENMRNIGIYQLRGAISICTCIFAGFCFFQLDKSWDSVPSRWGLLFFIPVFLAGISLTLVPSFQHNYKVFSQEKLSGYYGDSQFLVSTFVASLPFVVLIALSSACSVYFLAGLYLEGDRFPYFVLILILVQLVVESVVHAITSVCENSLLGILAGFGILGVFLLTCGFFTFQGLVPRIVFHYPLYYLSFYSFALSGLMTNEFSGQEGFACICPVQVADCPHLHSCSISGKEILDFFQVPAREKYFDALVLLGNVVAYRVLFLVGMNLRDTKKRFRQQLNVMPRPRRVAPRVVSYKQEYVRAATIPLSAFNSA